MATAETPAIIFATLAARVDEMAGVLDVTVAMPNAPFTPPVRSGTRAPYLVMTYMPNGSDLDGLPFDGDVTHVGLLQVSIFWPSAQGIVKPLSMAGAISDWFPAGLRLENNGVQVNVDRTPVIAPALQESDLVQVPVTIRWRASAINP